MRSRNDTSTIATLRAARVFTRRVFMKSACAAGTVATLAPAIVRDAFSSSGEVHIICWDKYLPPAFLKAFEKKTGIKTFVTSIGSNEALINKMKATKGRGFDIISPTLNRKGQWIDLQLTQPWDLNKIRNLSNVEPRFLAQSSTWTWNGGQHHLPHIWGTEAIAWRTDMWTSEDVQPSLGDLWRPELRGTVQGRPHSMLAGIGRHLAEIGKLPPFDEAYKNEERMRKIWDEIQRFALAHRKWVKAFWNDHNSQKTNILQNGCVIGQTWDGPMVELMKQGKPVQYMAPKEGAFAWLDGLARPVGSANAEQAHAFVDAIYTAKAAAQMANASGYNATVKGTAPLLEAPAKKAFESAYPGNALAKLWWWPDEPTWYARLREGYRDRFVAA